METTFFLCTVCGNVVVKTVDSGADVSCCGREMIELVPNQVEKGKEMHLPAVECKGRDIVKVKIGSEAHPMTDDHHIMFIYLETENGGQIRYLSPGKPAEAVFHVGSDIPVAVYCYCNIHGLWRSLL